MESPTPDPSGQVGSSHSRARPGGGAWAWRMGVGGKRGDPHCHQGLRARLKERLNTCQR